MPVSVLAGCSAHPTEDELENYSFGRLSEPELAHLEEHLFVCSHCQERLETVEHFIAVFKAGTAAWEADAFRRPTPHFPWPHLVPARGTFVKGALAAALICVSLVAAGRVWRHPQPMPPATVKLVAMRGGEPGGMAKAPSGRPLDLTVDSATLPAEPGYHLALVNQMGREIWNAAPSAEGTLLKARITDAPRRGVYWVRLYSQRGELLREFGLRIE